MPRAEVGTPKWVANKMKSKGLQRLRWFCQMCEKQCRDENGFKCHCLSESHQRQMQVFSQRANKYMDEFSREFEAVFMQLMRTRYCRTKVLANTVYQDVIADKQHIHMNSTIWTTLSAFVLYLQRTEKVTVEETERGFVIEYIDREKIRREQEANSKRKAELTAEQRREKQLNSQVEAAWNEKKKDAKEEASDEPEVVKFQRDETSEPIKFNLSANTSSTVEKKVECQQAADSNPSGTASTLSRSSTQSNPLLLGAMKPSGSSAVLKSSSSSLSLSHKTSRANNPLDKAATTNQVKMETGKRKLTVLEKLMLEDQQRKKQRR